MGGGGGDEWEEGEEMSGRRGRDEWEEGRR